MTINKEIYFSIDIETDGPIPGENSMLSLGAVAYAEDGTEVGSHEVNLTPLPYTVSDPDTMEWWNTQPKAWAAVQENQVKAIKAMPAFAEWIEELCHPKGFYTPVAVCYPAAFDFMFVSWYLQMFAGYNPFAFRCIDVRSFVMAHESSLYIQTTKNYWSSSWFSSSPHTHIAVDDAREQGQTFMNILRENRK